MVRIIEKIC